MEKTHNTSIETTRYRQFIGCMLAFALFYYLRYFKHVMTGYNTTLFAMSYEYGFISRGMLGTIWTGLDALLPIDLMTYEAVYWFTWGATWAFQILLISFLGYAIRHVEASHRHNMYYVAIACAIYFFPMFWSEEMFGRLDVYLYLLSLCGIFLILCEKREWMLLPIGALAMCIHQGFVFTNANLILVPLFYRICTSSGKRRRKYVVLFVLFLLEISALFLYFEFFSHGNGSEIYEDVVAAARALSEDCKSYNESILMHEILGQDVYESEARLHALNRTEFPAFLVLYAPYLPIVIHFFRGLFSRDGAFVETGVDLGISDEYMVEEAKKSEKKSVVNFLQRSKTEGGYRFAHLAFLLGALTMLPQYLLKVDFGRYAFTIFTYYILMLMVLILMKDEHVANQLDATKEKIKATIPVPWIVLLYPMFLMPFYDVIISGASSKLRTLVEEIVAFYGR